MQLPQVQYLSGWKKRKGDKTAATVVGVELAKLSYGAIFKLLQLSVFEPI